MSTVAQQKCPKCDGYGQLQYDPQNPFSQGSTNAGPWHCNNCMGTGVVYIQSTCCPCCGKGMKDDNRL